VQQHEGARQLVVATQFGEQGERPFFCPAITAYAGWAGSLISARALTVLHPLEPYASVHVFDASNTARTRSVGQDRPRWASPGLGRWIRARAGKLAACN
jgi:hypothetical protein